MRQNQHPQPFLTPSSPLALDPPPLCCRHPSTVNDMLSALRVPLQEPLPSCIRHPSAIRPPSVRHPSAIRPASIRHPSAICLNRRQPFTVRHAKRVHCPFQNLRENTSTTSYYESFVYLPRYKYIIKYICTYIGA
jgi:hypothetical protein